MTQDWYEPPKTIYCHGCDQMLSDSHHHPAACQNPNCKLFRLMQIGAGTTGSAQRLRNVRAALGSVIAEGVEPSPEVQEWMARYISGWIDGDRLREEVKRVVYPPKMPTSRETEEVTKTS